MILVFTVVGLARSTITPSIPTPNSSNAARKRSAPMSSPITAIGTGAAPSETRFETTLPAPPSAIDWRSTSTTGTGASGEMRRTRPQMNSSSIKSPRTTIRLPEKAPASVVARSRVSLFIKKSRSRLRQCNLKHFVDSGDDFINGDPFNRAAIVTITRSSLAAKHSIRRFGPRMPHVGIRRTKHREYRAIDCRRNVHRTAVIAYEHEAERSNQSRQFGERYVRQHNRIRARRIGDLFGQSFLPGAGDDDALDLPSAVEMLDHRCESASTPALRFKSRAWRNDRESRGRE